MSSYYRRQTTYRHDFNKGQAPDYDQYGLRNSIEFSRPKFDDQVYQRGRNESQEQYEDRMKDLDREMKRREEHHHDPRGAMTERRFEEMEHERRRHYDDYNGPMTERRHEEMDRRMERRYEGGHMTDRDYRNPPTYEMNDGRHGDPPPGYKFDRYRPTQKDYGSFKTQPKIESLPPPYRGQFDRQIDNFQNKVLEKQLVNPSTLPPHPNHENFETMGNLTRLPKPSSGVYLFLTIPKGQYKRVKASFDMHKSMLNQLGRMTGIATEPYVFGDGIMSTWMPRKRNDRSPESGDLLVVLWFPSAESGHDWIISDPDFKLTHFPDHDGHQRHLVSVNYNPSDEAVSNTFLLTEFPEVRHSDFFREKVIEPLKRILDKYETCEPFVVYTNGHWDFANRKWQKTDTVTVCHRFINLAEAKRFHDESAEIRNQLTGITRGGRSRTVLFTI